MPDKKSLSAGGSQLWKWAVIVLLPLTAALVPCGAAYTVEIKKFLVVTLCAIAMFATEAIDNTIASLLLMIFYVIVGIAPFSTAFAAWTQELPWMMIGSFVVVAVIQRTTILKRIAYWCVLRTGGTYKGLLMGMVALGMITCTLIPSTSAAVIVAAITYGICESLHLGRSREAAGIMLAGQLGFMESYLFVYSPTFISVIFSTIHDTFPVDMDYLTYLKHNAVFIPYVFLVGFLMTKMIRPAQPVFDRGIFRERLRELGPMQTEEKKTLTVLLLLVAYLLTYQWHGFPMIYGFLIAPALLYAPGIRVGRKEDLQQVNYGAVIFIAACMSIGTVATSIGLGDVIVDTLTPALQGMSPVLFLGIIWLIVVALNFLMTPVAEMTALGVPLTKICMRMGITPLVMCYTVFQGGSQLLLPYEVTMWLVAFGFGNVPMKDFIKICGMKMLVCFVYLMTVGMLYWKLIGLL